MAVPTPPDFEQVQKIAKAIEMKNRINQFYINEALAAEGARKRAEAVPELPNMEAVLAAEARANAERAERKAKAVPAAPNMEKVLAAAEKIREEREAAAGKPTALQIEREKTKEKEDEAQKQLTNEFVDKSVAAVGMTDDQLVKQIMNNDYESVSYVAALNEMISRGMVYDGTNARFEDNYNPLTQETEKKPDEYKTYSSLNEIDYNKGFFIKNANGEMNVCRPAYSGSLRMMPATEDKRIEFSTYNVQDKINAIDRSPKLGETVEKMDELLKNNCVYDEYNRLITTKSALLNEYRYSKIQIHSPFDLEPSKLIDNPLPRIETAEKAKVESAFEVLRDKNATEAQRQEAIDGLIKEGFKIMSNGEAAVGKEVKSASEIGTSFRIGLPSEQKGYAYTNTSYACMKNTTGEYTCLNSAEYRKDMAENNKNKDISGVIDPWRKKSYFSANSFMNDHIGENAFSDDNDRWNKKDTDKLLRYHYLYDENDQLITDEATLNSKDVVIVHAPDTSSERDHNGLVVRTPGKEAGEYTYHYFNSLELDRDETFKPLAQVIAGKPSFEDVKKVGKFLREGRGVWTYGKEGFEAIKKTALASLVKAGYVVDPQGKTIENAESLTAGKKFMIQAKDGDTVYRDGFEMKADGSAKCVVENMAYDPDKYFDFVKPTIPQPKEPNGLLKAIDSINRFFGGKGLESCNKYRAEKIAAERQAFVSARNMFADNKLAKEYAIELHQYKSAELQAWEREKMAEQMNVQVQGNETALDAAIKSSDGQAYLDQCEANMMAKYLPVPKAPDINKVKAIEAEKKAELAQKQAEFRQKQERKQAEKEAKVQNANKAEGPKDIEAEREKELADFLKKAEEEDEKLDKELAEEKARRQQAKATREKLHIDNKAPSNNGQKPKPVENSSVKSNGGPSVGGNNG